MSERAQITAQQLQAFVDGQLDPSDRAQVLLALQGSSELQAEHARLLRLRELVRLAYDEAPASPPPVPTVPRLRGYAVAAVLGGLLVLAATQIGGWNWRQLFLQPGTVAAVGVEQSGTATAGVAELLMFHVSGNSDAVVEELLDQVQLVADTFRARGRMLRIMVLANNQGLRIFDAGNGRVARRIGELFARYDNITFAACGATLARLAGSQHPITLLPQAIVVDSGVAEITRRQRGGWKYIRI